LGFILAISAIALTLAGWFGGEATGQRVVLSFQTECAPEWGELVSARGESVGLGEPVLEVLDGEVKYTATLPGVEDEMTSMPALLTATGRLEIFASEDGETPLGEPLITEADLVEAHMNLDARGHPFTDVEFHTGATGPIHEHRGPMLYYVDGVFVDKWLGLVPFSGDTVRLQPRSESKANNMRRSADIAIVLQHGAAPCEFTGLSTVAVQ
jgi:hypothetical protein